MNKVIITGNLTKDPEKRSTQQGTSVTSFTVAVQRRFKNQNGNYEADFINCVAWRGTADFVAQYFSKGSRIGVVGSIQTRSYEDNSGNKRYITEVIADEVEFDGGKKQERTGNTGQQEALVDRDARELFGDEISSFTPSDDSELPF